MELAPVESAHFAIPIGRASVSSAEETGRIIGEAREAGASLLIIRVDIAAVDAVHAVEALAGRLCDTLVYYGRDPRDAQHAGGVRLATPVDADDVAAVAADSFKDYAGHFRADPRLDGKTADLGYVDWARRSVLDRRVADRVWVYEQEGQITGFLSWRRNGDDECEILLNAVHPSFRRRGMYTKLVSTALAATRSEGARACIVSTQLANWAVQRAWMSMGFLPLRAMHTFHLWLE